MNQPSPRDLRNAVVLAILVSVILTVAVMDRCARMPPEPTGPSRSVAP